MSAGAAVERNESRCSLETPQEPSVPCLTAASTTSGPLPKSAWAATTRPLSCAATDARPMFQLLKRPSSIVRSHSVPSKLHDHSVSEPESVVITIQRSVCVLLSRSSSIDGCRPDTAATPAADASILQLQSAARSAALHTQSAVSAVSADEATTPSFWPWSLASGVMPLNRGYPGAHRATVAAHADPSRLHEPNLKAAASKSYSAERAT
eukprot:Amastigsp_a343156_5.p5 type:complete len:209 gc:universal Amastigsp_a343156_5:1044-418(-)